MVEFGGIEPNPQYDTLRKGIEMVRQEKVDFLLGVGGGSVHDGTKFIAAAYYYDGDPWDIVAKDVTLKKAVPLGTVLTLPATGSEMNGGAVISRASTREKRSFSSPLTLSRFSVLDPSVMHSLPDRQIQNGIIDAFVHVTEQYLTYSVGFQLQERFAEGILITLIEQGPKFLADKNNYNAAANIMWSATMALCGLISTGVPGDWATHNIGNELTAYHNIDHARTLAIVLPGVLQHQKETKKERLLQYGERVWGILTGREEDRIRAAIWKTEAFFHFLGVPTHLRDYNVPESTIGLIKNRLAKLHYKLGENQDIGPAEIEEILRLRM